MAIADTISSMYENVGEVYDTITNVDVNNGKNLFNDTIRQGVTTYDGGVYSYNATRLTSTNWTTLRAGTYTINAKTNTSKTLQISNITFDTNDNFYNLSGVSGIWKTLPFTFTTPIDIKWKCNFDYSDNSNITINEVNSIQLELGSSATEYQPYTDNPTYKNIENIPKVIRKSYLNIMNNGIDTIYDNWEKVNGTGTSLTLNNTEEAPMTIEYKGNTSQETTTGKNLLPNNQTTQTINGVTFTMNSDKSVTITGTATVNTDYYFVGTSSEYEDFGLTTGTYNLNGCTGGSEQTYMLFTVMNRNGNIYYYNNTYAGGRNMIVETGDKFRIFIRVISGKNVNTTIYPQINEGSTALSYEPYTNGATPRPTYPQDIHIVSGDNYINVVGKNLFDYNKITTSSNYINNYDGTFIRNSNGSNITINVDNASVPYDTFSLLAGTYSVSFDITTTSAVTINNWFLCTRQNGTGSNLAKSLGVQIPANTTTHIKAENYVVPNNAERVGFAGYLSASTGVVISNIQVEKGTSSSEYEGYKGASYEINLGKNLLDLQSSIIKSLNTSGTWNENVYTHNGLTITINDDKTIKINGTATAQETFLLENQQIKYPTGTYYLSGSINGGNNSYDIRMFNYDGTSAVAQCYTGVKEINVINNKQVYNVAIVVRSGQTLNNVVFYPMFSTSNDTNYSPYFTPIYLASIPPYKNRIFKSSGKNLFDKDNVNVLNATINSSGVISSNNNCRTIYIPIKPNTTYTIQKVLSTQFRASVYDEEPQINSTGTNTIANFSGTTITITSTTNSKYLAVFCYINTDTQTYQQILDSIMINEGSTALPYEPYGKDWYLNKQIGKLVLDGSENWQDAGTDRFNIVGTTTDYLKKDGATTYICNNYEAFNQTISNSSFNNLVSNVSYGFNMNSSTGFDIRFKHTGIDDVNDFKTWLSTHNTIVYYALATPTYEKITGELLNQLEAIKNSYENQTNINQENNDLPFELEVGALEKY